MIQLENVSKSYYLEGIRTQVANNISVTFPTGSSVALIGRNGAGKSSLLRIVAGTMHPDEGTVVTDGSISWPVGFAGSFHGDLTGAQNVRFVARVYGVDTDTLVAFVEDFAELGVHLHQPFRTYSSGMRSRLAFGVSMGIQFDTYLVDEVTSVGDAAFKAKSERVFQERMRSASSIVVSHSLDMLRRTCDAAAILEAGELTYYDDIEEAITLHKLNMGV